MFQLLLTLLRILFPLDPVAQLREVTRFFIASLLEDLATPDRLLHLETCADCRMRLEGQIASAEDGIQQAIHERARQIAGLPFVFVHRNHEHPPRRARPLDQILARLHRMLALPERIEDLAQRRAATIERELANNPLRLDASHRSTSPACALEANTCRQIIVQIASLSAQHWGKWIATSSSRDGGEAKRVDHRTSHTKNNSARALLMPISEVAGVCA